MIGGVTVWLTFAPCSAKISAMAAPMPLGFPEPVTMAVLPFSVWVVIVYALVE